MNRILFVVFALFASSGAMAKSLACEATGVMSYWSQDNGIHFKTADEQWVYAPRERSCETIRATLEAPQYDSRTNKYLCSCEIDSNGNGLFVEATTFLGDFNEVSLSLIVVDQVKNTVENGRIKTIVDQPVTSKAEACAALPVPKKSSVESFKYEGTRCGNGGWLTCASASYAVGAYSNCE